MKRHEFAREPEILKRVTVRLVAEPERARITTRELGWAYLFGLKGNQSGVLDRAERLPQEQVFPPADGCHSGTLVGHRERCASIADVPDDPARRNAFTESSCLPGNLAPVRA